ncbi:PREDICTED: homeobox protein knotted-1-like 13 isoform X2 [Nelumbo nucifera]|uniref:Homeobox protein knotted-1-like 13 isoform X2 n=1 Tax=Nelumbo nucifera TaxID=4432 RepID=A0A1U7ZAK1_NELNU|nr:PREDICTED: homeobox protein knotted-1-like 13 isoform X2 [Nelumbo nucifera]
MAFHNHLSHEMALQHFTEQHLGENTAVLRSIIPEQLGQTSSDGTGGAGKEQKDIQRLMIETGGKPKQQQPPPGQQHHLGGGGGGGGPTWLSNAILRQQNQYVDGSFLHLQTNSDSPTSAASNQWLPRPILQRNASDVGGGDDVPVSSDSMIAAAMSHNSADLNANNDNRNSGNNQNPGDNSGGAELAESEAGGGGDGVGSWQNAKYKADILAHPLYEQLLSAHVACLRIATPVDQLPRIDAQLAQSQHVVAKYSVLGHGNQQLVSDDKELDQFMTHYVLLLCSFKEQLQQHVRVHAMEAVMACWELEQSLQSLTGVSPGEGTGATMSDDDDDQADSDANLFDGSLDGTDSMGFGPLIPTESERSLMERVRQELKHDLKQGYKEKIVDIREEILRKRRAGKLPGDTTSLLKAWWQSHAKWPYPTEEDKARLVQETGLQLKQINNWFINQRKRNWHSNPSSSTALKSKRKSNAGENSGERFL